MLSSGCSTSSVILFLSLVFNIRLLGVCPVVAFILLNRLVLAIPISCAKAFIVKSGLSILFSITSIIFSRIFLSISFVASD